MKKLFLGIALLLCYSCAHTKYIEVPVPEYHVKVVNKTDTVHIADSVREYKTSILQQVDSAYLVSVGIINPPKSVWFLQETQTKQEKSTLNHVSRDTIIERDTISVPYQIEKRVEVNVLYWWQKGLMWIGVVVLLAVIVWIVKVLKRK